MGDLDSNWQLEEALQAVFFHWFFLDNTFFFTLFLK